MSPVRRSKKGSTLEQIKPSRIDTDLLELRDRKVHIPQKIAVSKMGMISTAPRRMRSSWASTGRKPASFVGAFMGERSQGRDRAASERRAPRRAERSRS